MLFILLFSISDGFGKEVSVGNNNDTIKYQINTKESKLSWYCDLHNGYVLLDSGTISIYNNEIISGKFTICMESLIDLDINDYELMRLTLENTLKSIEFFNTALFHQSYFNIDIAKKSKKGYIITGELILMNIEQCISFDSKFDFTDDKLLITSDSIIIDRNNWGISSMSKNDAKSNESFIVPDDIGIVVRLVAIQEQND